jgi:hypothetical protein
MIKIEVDEAYAFDYLSILLIKKDFSEKSFNQWFQCFDFLRKQIGNEIIWSDMINSDEFKKMIEANQLTFDAVNKAKNNEITARDVDYCNYQRHIAKINFQKKFFSCDLNEIKIGYEKYENKN